MGALKAKLSGSAISAMIFTSSDMIRSPVATFSSFEENLFPLALPAPLGGEVSRPDL